MTEPADIRIYTTEAFRARVKAACANEDMTYEELLRELLDFREEHEEAWEGRNEDGSVRRRTGGMKD